MWTRKGPFVQMKTEKGNTNIVFLKEHVQDVLKKEMKLYKKESLSYSGKEYIQIDRQIRTMLYI